MVEYTIKLSKKDDDLIKNMLEKQGYNINHMEQSLKQHLLSKCSFDELIDKAFGKIPNDSIILDDLPCRLSEIVLFEKIDDDNFSVVLEKSDVSGKKFILTTETKREKEPLFDSLLKDIKKYFEDNKENFINVNENLTINRNSFKNVTYNKDENKIQIEFVNALGTYNIQIITSGNMFDFIRIMLQNELDKKYKS